MTVAACAALVERGDPDRFLAAMSCPPEARSVLFPLHAFNLEVSRAPYVTQEPMIAEMRLQWWRDALDEIGRGETPRAHEVAGSLAEVIRTHGLPLELLDRAAAARRWDIWREPFADRAAFDAHMDATAGDLSWCAALALGAEARAEGAVRDAAYGGAVAFWLSAVPDLEARGQRPLADGRPEAVAALAREARLRLAGARAGAGGPAAAFALRWTWQADRLLRRAEADPGRVARGELPVSEFRRKLSLARVAARGSW
ncbi:squalene/phytoene synthase family protein [Roseisalinus antarcticus]|uniref:Squalene/phytoene synthase n=1 Tax=Roseisalinus antarcticus TaxID=254357 RepID=A0A1Y5RFY4_9RHOB|nr:squalene/phytoene synthase family protein [Roseisalinus antarcticus]SLN13769.1 Squalene/phytoene synthase [Roseisalinus antarcticus]